jgi:flavorubredoxin
MFPQVREAVARGLPLERLRWISFSHFEADECGALNELLAVAPHALPLCGHLLAMLSVNDVADRQARVLGDGEVMDTGKFRVQWLDTPRAQTRLFHLGGISRVRFQALAD